MRLVKAYIFMMFNEYFIIKNGVCCSESCDSSIKKILNKSNQTEEREEVFNDNREEVFNDSREKLNVIGQDQEGSEEQIEISEEFFDIAFLLTPAADLENKGKAK